MESAVALVLALLALPPNVAAPTLTSEQAEAIVCESMPWCVRGEDWAYRHGEPDRSYYPDCWTPEVIAEIEAFRTWIPVLDSAPPDKLLLVTWSGWRGEWPFHVWLYAPSSRELVPYEGTVEDARRSFPARLVGTLKFLSRPDGRGGFEVAACMGPCGIFHLIHVDGEWQIAPPFANVMY